MKLVDNSQTTGCLQPGCTLPRHTPRLSSRQIPRGACRSRARANRRGKPCGDSALYGEQHKVLLPAGGVPFKPMGDFDGWSSSVGARITTPGFGRPYYGTFSTRRVHFQQQGENKFVMYERLCEELWFKVLKVCCRWYLSAMLEAFVYQKHRPRTLSQY